MDYTKIIISLIGLYGIIFTALYTYNKQRKSIRLESQLKAKKEAYSAFLESLCNYMFENESDMMKAYQLCRMRLVLYADDDTIKAFLKSHPEGMEYNIKDPISIILYSLRKDIEPSSRIKREEMAGIDPAQFEFKIMRKKV